MEKIALFANPAAGIGVYVYGYEKNGNAVSQTRAGIVFEDDMSKSMCHRSLNRLADQAIGQPAWTLPVYRLRW